MTSRRSGSICIDVGDYIDVISDDDLLDEVRDRKLILADGVTDACPLELIEEAREALLIGRPAEALCILERLVNPKWKHKRDAQADYEYEKRLAQIPSHR